MAEHLTNARLLVFTGAQAGIALLSPTVLFHPASDGLLGASKPLGDFLLRLPLLHVQDALHRAFVISFCHSTKFTQIRKGYKSATTIWSGLSDESSWLSARFSALIFSCGLSSSTGCLTGCLTRSSATYSCSTARSWRTRPLNTLYIALPHRRPPQRCRF